MIHFFTPLKNIKLENFDVEYLELIPGVNISNNKNIKEKLLSDLNINLIGILEADYFKSSEAFLFYDYENEDEIEIFQGLTNLQRLHMILLWIDDLFKNLWLIKDNNVLTDTAFLIPNSKDPTSEAASMRLQYQLTSSNGRFEDVIFSKEELSKFSKYHDDIENHFHLKNSGSMEFMLEKNFSRINRGLIFVKQAREARNLAYKISNYCSALETIFSTDNVELSHKLSERVSFFLKDEFNILETFKNVKKSYAVRSKLTHGDTLDAKQIEILDDISIKIDNILRISINKIINNKNLLTIFESPKNVIDQYFEELIFGK